MAGEILFIIGSARPVRVGGQLGRAILDQIPSTNGPEVRVADLREIALPILDEPRMAATGDYQHEHTRNWARMVGEAAAIVVLTPEYNWGYPASVKNAIDYLYAEWKDKPGLLISYGGGGGKRSYEQLKQVLGRVGVSLVETPVNIVLRGEYGDDDRLADPARVVADNAEALGKAWQELLDKVGTPS
ncbi:NADPH-dependent FMN reductase [Lolliginicoccus suaedae]|uniref:NADPH-dependent FMN reductase n=1 Tax=Lolliginicoccus suaedae TaxID=2605429 RepID=UPI0011ECFEE2|nr:NAD(P)H-dependent oxidoreductase [Lolliginicoccus suaedae]